ncbi:MAG: hypothetical protein ABI068_13910 [Ktedonobacterales bacterium]
MSRNITISISDAEYAALKAAGAANHVSLEELAAETLSAQPQQGTPHETAPSEEQNSDARRARTALLAIMRQQGHLVEPASVTHVTPDQLAGALPPVGSPERAVLEERIGDELSDALEQSGLDILGLDILGLIERR